MRHNQFGLKHRSAPTPPYSLLTTHLPFYMFNKLKQFKDIRDRAKSIQSSLSKEHAEGSAGWGKVKVTVDGNQRVTSVVIDPSLETKDIPGLVKDAANDAMEKIQKILASKMKDLGGLDLAQEMQQMMKK